MHKNGDISSGITYRNELLRKGIHLLSLTIPILYSFTDRSLAIAVLAPMAIISVLIDVLSHVNHSVREMMFKVFGKLLRPHEVRSDKILLNGASYVLISALLCVVIFPKIIMITAFSILIVSDTAAALFGRKFGRSRFFDKSLEGAGAFFFSAAGVIALVGISSDGNVPFFLSGMIAAAAGAVVESASIRLRLDDNLSIPLSVGGVLLLGDWIATHFFNHKTFLTLLP